MIYLAWGHKNFTVVSEIINPGGCRRDELERELKTRFENRTGAKFCGYEMYSNRESALMQQEYLNKEGAI